MLKNTNISWLKQKTRTPSPIPFAIKFRAQDYDIAQLIKTAFKGIQERSDHIFWRSQIVAGYTRNPNIGNFLVRAKKKLNSQQYTMLVYVPERYTKLLNLNIFSSLHLSLHPNRHQTKIDQYSF